MRASRFASALAKPSAMRFGAPLAACCMAFVLAPAAQARAYDGAQVAWLRDGKLHSVALRPAAPTPDPAQTSTQAQADAPLPNKIPLGSLWKIFVYAYLAQTQAQEAAYVCPANAATASADDAYCCNPGESVARDPALARSCAPYFAPKRLGLSSASWQAFWRQRTQAAWLLDLEHLQPQTETSVTDLLEALQAIPPQARQAARAALLQTGLEGYGREAWPQLGSGMRYKTYSWHRVDGSALGGAAGWLADGTPFWFGASGSSRTALAAWAAPLARALPQPQWSGVGAGTGDTSCVDVDFFARYPLRAVWKADTTTPATTGDMNGRYRLQFANGNWLNVASHGELALVVAPGAAPVITGRMTVNDYVARVVDREGSGAPVQAARALAIAARSYLLQNARFEGACWHIADASQTQRVSAQAPSDAARAAAWFTDDIVLNGIPVRYHRDKAATNQLAWNNAVARADAGWGFERILAEAYPKASIATVSGRTQCQRLDAAETWLAYAAPGWNKRLRREPGFEALATVPNICALAQGHPYSDLRGLRIYARGWRSLDERLTLAHEYVHLALRFHPHGADEDYVERLARQLIEG